MGGTSIFLRTSNEVIRQLVLVVEEEIRSRNGCAHSSSLSFGIGVYCDLIGRLSLLGTVIAIHLHRNTVTKCLHLTAPSLR